MYVYDELKSGRFLVIADFENPVHMELFRLDAESPGAACVLSTKRGRKDTGPGALVFTAGTSDDALVVSNTGSSGWYLKRDWRPYDLLLLSVHAPASSRRAGEHRLTLELSIAGGPIARLTSAHSSLPLEPGWNTFRIDLAEVAERIPLDEVRELRFRVTGADEPVQLCFDDLILTAHRESLVGDPANTDGALYVQQIGRRWRVGAGGLFELTFAGGQIVAWFNLAADPYRLRNLVEGTVLGPSPLALYAADSDDPGIEAFGKKVAVRERIIEANAVRTRIACEWWFVDRPEQPMDQRPFQRWLYTIYPSGQLYVSVEHSTGNEAWTPQQWALTVSVASQTDARFDVGRLESPAADTADRTLHFATWHSDQASSSLLYVPLAGEVLPSIREESDALRRRTSFLATTNRSHKETQHWTGHVFLGDVKAAGESDFARRAEEYLYGPKLRLEVGTAVVAGASSATASTPGTPTVGTPFAGVSTARSGVSIGKGSQSGFDHSEGCTVLRPDAAAVRLTIGDRDRPAHSPAFRVVDTAGLEAWVYVDHLVFTHVARDPAGDLIFQLPDTITQPTVVEVVLRRPQSE